MRIKTLGFITVFVGLLCMYINSNAQSLKDPVLLTIDGQPVRVSEFLNIYSKNNVQSEASDKKSMDEYLDLFINFKLKVRDAEVNGLDTIKALKDELAGYRKQLSAPYFIDSAVFHRLIDEAYERMQWDLRASHILIRCDKDALPADTLVAWERMDKILQKARSGEPFDKLALQYSEDPSARDREATSQHPFIRGNRGDLGFFSVFNMVYPFETAAYNTQLSQISDIVRTDFGYHIIHVTDKRPALGRAQVAHIFFQIPPKSSHADSLRIQSRVDSVYQLLLNGADFAQLAKTLSDDKGSAMRDGVLPWFTCNRLVPEFVERVYPLKNGEIAQPVLTSYGWHIIKMIDRKPVGSFDEVYNDLVQRIEKDMRYNLCKQSVLNRLKNEYQLSQNQKALSDFYKWVDDSIFVGKWQMPPAKKLKKQLFSFDDKKYSQADFAQYLYKTQKKQPPKDKVVYVNNMYKAYVDQEILAYEDANLETKYPEFGLLMKEYHDGILLFEITQKKVWDKAIKDTTGLQQYYEKVKYSYMWPQRKEATVVKVKNIVDDQTAKQLAKQIAEWINLSDMTTATLKNKILQDSTLLVDIAREKFVVGDNALIDKLHKPGEMTQEIIPDESGKFNLDLVILHRIVDPEPKALDDVRGHITAEYQNYLEKEWINELRSKYSWKVNDEVFKMIKAQY